MATVVKLLSNTSPKRDYSGLEQSLARANLATMIKPGGFLLTNEALQGSAPSTRILCKLRFWFDKAKPSTCMGTCVRSDR
jgi:hypothetical protein